MFMIEDFIASYPDSNVPNLQTLLTNKRELNELAPPLVENPPARCEFYKHQELFKRLLMQYDKILLMDRTGTGKSISAINGSESIHRLILSVRTAMDAIPYISRAIFLVKGDILAEEFKQQLVYKGTCAGTYDVDIVLNAKTFTAEKSAITRTIKDWWLVDHFQHFANSLHGMTDEEIIEEYSGSIVFIDESHYIKDLNILEADAANKLKQAEQKEVNFTKNGKPKKEFGNIYYEFHRFLHLIKRSKTVLMSATPMINDPDEIVAPLNLLNPLDFQIREEQFNWNTITLDQLYPYIVGKVSFIRELDTGIQLNYYGTIPNATFIITDHLGRKLEIPFQTTIYFTQMSKFQSDAYNTVSGGNYEINKRNASCFIFPDSSYGGDFERNTRTTATITTETGKVRGKKTERKEYKQQYGQNGITKYVVSQTEDTFTATPEFSKYLSNYDNIKKSSSKYADILTKYSSTLASRTGTKYLEGSVFIYSALKSGSGAFVLGLCLEHHGFTRYIDTSSSFDRNTGQIKIAKGLRYAMITGETPNSRKATILELFNSPQNRYGEYIKILIGNETTQAGISLNNVINFDLIVADWHSAGVYQALSRILRATAYINLIQDYRGVRIPVRVFFHGSLSNSGDYIEINNLNNYLATNNFFYDQEHKNYTNGTTTFTSVDLYLYMKSEDKNHHIKRVERMLVQTALNAQINYFRNHRDTDINYTEICYYDTCDFEFSDPASALAPILPLTPETQWSNLKNPATDLSTFDIYYSEPLVNHIIELLIDIFRSDFTIYVQQLLKLPQFQDFPEKYIWFAVNKILAGKLVLYSRFGEPSYLYTNADKIWISSKYPEDYETDLTDIYSQNYVSLSRIPLEDYVDSVDVKQREIAERMFIKFDEDDWNTLSLTLKVELFERAYALEVLHRQNSTNLQKLINPFISTVGTFRVNAITLNTIETEFKHWTEDLRKLVSTFRLSDDDKDTLNLESKDDQKVTVHWIYNRPDQRDKYTASMRLNKISLNSPIRIFENGIFRKAQGFEQVVYSYLISEGIEKKLAPFKNTIYAFVDLEGNTRLMDDRPRDLMTSTSGSTKNRGKLGKPPKADMEKLMIDAGYPFPENGYSSEVDLQKLFEQWLQRNGRVFDYRKLNL
jgi:hypothetical protein